MLHSFVYTLNDLPSIPWYDHLRRQVIFVNMCLKHCLSASEKKEGWHFVWQKSTEECHVFLYLLLFLSQWNQVKEGEGKWKQSFFSLLLTKSSSLLRLILLLVSSVSIPSFVVKRVKRVNRMYDIVKSGDSGLETQVWRLEWRRHLYTYFVTLVIPLWDSMSFVFCLYSSTSSVLSRMLSNHRLVLH